MESPSISSPPASSSSSAAEGVAGIKIPSKENGVVQPLRKNEEVVTRSGASNIGVAVADVAAMRPTEYDETPPQENSDQQAPNQLHIGGMSATQQVQPPFASMMVNQNDMLNPMFLLMTPQQRQQMILFHQQAQLLAVQSFPSLNLQLSQSGAFAAASDMSSQNQPTHPDQHYYAQQMAQSVFQHQFVNQSLYNAAISQTQYSLMGQMYNHAAISAHQSLFHQASPYSFYQNHQNFQGMPPSAGKEIHQSDAPNHQAPQDGDDEGYEEDYDEDEDYDDDSDRPSRSLLRLVEDHQWVAAAERITTHPHETHKVGMQGRTPLHVACDHDAPPPFIQALLSAWPEGAERVGTSQMNPLHITCSSPRASVDVVRVLLTGCRDPLMITGAKDVDGDTPLHAACRFSAPMDVLVTLLQANPAPIMWKDYEGLNPLMRLWVRYFVLVGEQIISNIKQQSDITGDLIEAWEKSLLLLQVMYAIEKRGRVEQNQVVPFRAVHAASSVDCPRCVVRIAMVLYHQELLMRDELNRLPIHIAAVAPVFCVHDLRGEGDQEKKESQNKYKEPSVIEILLCGERAAARERDPHGRLPLHLAIMRGKTWDDGVKALVEAFPEALTIPDNQTNLHPFMLAASVGRGRGDCTTIYALLRAAPDLVQISLQQETQEDAEESSELEENPHALKSDT